ncbi:hypothetical protein E2C01_026430 [Portunus trituberculatus]|uniref:Uncharacterized protein n=1 Tax=Portunus trituberculatus TaxID=210409 RepID=A0A5B7EI99_PORTR|nr:hypothetical protein [Portunus trituberculatus]
MPSLAPPSRPSTSPLSLTTVLPYPSSNSLQLSISLLLPPFPPCLILRLGSALPADADLDTLTHTLGDAIQGAACGRRYTPSSSHPARPIRRLSRDKYNTSTYLKNAGTHH